MLLDEYIKPEIRKMNESLYEYNVEKIKIFFEPYNPY